MAEDQPLTRKRSEILFDDLRGQDPSLNNENAELEQNNVSVPSISNNVQTKKPKIDYRSESKNSNKSASSNVNVPADISKYKGLLQHIDNYSSIEELCSGLQTGNNLATRCESALSLAVFCRSQLPEEDCEFVFQALNIISDNHRFYAFSFCQALLLYVLTKQNINSHQLEILEKSILTIAHSVINPDGILKNNFMEARIILLGGERYLTAFKLCEELFFEQNLDVNSLDVPTICCSALKNLSKLSSISSGRSKFTDGTLKYILSMIGKSTQEIVSENLIDMEEEEETISVSSYTVNQCLQVLEQILSVDPNSPCKTLDHEDFSLLRCLTKLLEWSMLSLFPQDMSGQVLFKVQNSLDTFYLSTLVSILKVFSVLSFDPDQYDSFTNIKGSMEKIMICILKTYFQSEVNHFDVLVLALELLINFAFKSKKTFVLLCLKKFPINDHQDILAIEALLKILDTSLENISKVKSRSTKKAVRTGAHSEKSADEYDDASSEEHDMDLVLQAADEDMELSTIVSFIGILLMLFIDTKKSFLEFAKEKFPVEKCLETVSVSKKFLQFALLTGGMPATGILLLKASIKKLNQLHSSS